ncbi:hypothetical protein ACFPMF_19450 [Larkinella bovis]|uniref:Methyl-accepting chemotaxis protein n=1 Tax=Larkinella bovis TaxID=683041 RepID=A0ABW0IDN0_9BACT
MEQKLSYTDIFFPNTLVEWGLLILLLLLFGIGWYCYYHSETRWQAQLKKLQDDELTDAVADGSIKDLITTSWQDSFLQSLPGIFLIVGLLGTFISLGTSLGELSFAIKNSTTEQSQLQPSKPTTSLEPTSQNEISQDSYLDSPQKKDAEGIAKDLNKVLEALGTKFKTSIWGIILNLFFRLVFLYSLENILSRLMRENLSVLSHHWRSKEKSNSETEKKWHDEVVLKNDEIINVLNRLATATDQGNQGYIEAAKYQAELIKESMYRQTDLFSRHFEQLASQNDKIILGLDELEKGVSKGNQINTIFHEYQSRFQENFRNEAIAHREKSLHIQDESKKYLLSVSETLVPFGQSVKDLGPIVVNMKELVDDVSKTLTTATNDFGGVAKSLNESVFTFKTEIEKALKESSAIMTENAGKMGSSIDRFNEQISTSFAAFSESVNGTLKLISDALATSTGEMKDTIAGSIEDTKSVIEKLDRHLGGIDQVLSGTKATLGAINEKFSEINEVIERVADSAKQVAGDSSRANIELTGVFKENGILNNQLKALVDSQEKLNWLVAAFPQQRLTEIGQELSHIKDTVERLTTSSAAITNAFKENGALSGQLQSLLDSHEKLNRLVAAFSPQHLAEIGQELGQIKNTVERLTNSTSTLYNELPSSLDGRGFLGTKLSSLIDNQQDIYIKIVDAIQANADRVVYNSKEKTNGEQKHNSEY